MSEPIRYDVVPSVLSAEVITSVECPEPLSVHQHALLVISHLFVCRN